MVTTLILGLGCRIYVYAQDPEPAINRPVLHGYWYDSESKGFYEFKDNGSFIFESKDGFKHEGTFDSSGQDQEGNFMFRAKYIDSKTGEEQNLFIRVNRDGRSGYTQHKCMKYPFYRSIES